MAVKNVLPPTFFVAAVMRRAAGGVKVERPEAKPRTYDLDADEAGAVLGQRRRLGRREGVSGHGNLRGSGTTVVGCVRAPGLIWVLASGVGAVDKMIDGVVPGCAAARSFRDVHAEA